MARKGQKKKGKPRYDPDLSHREKHRWDRPEADIIIDEDGKPVGKCPSDIDDKTAQDLLDNGIPFFQKGRLTRKYPQRVYNVFRGVPYRAHEMGRGLYHGFPELPDDVPPRIREDLRERACRSGNVEAFDAWMNRRWPELSTR